MYKYIGEGEYIPGVPARDLSDEEVEAHPAVRVSPLYKPGRTLADLATEALEEQARIARPGKSKPVGGKVAGG